MGSVDKSDVVKRFGPEEAKEVEKKLASINASYKKKIDEVNYEVEKMNRKMKAHFQDVYARIDKISRQLKSLLMSSQNMHMLWKEPRSFGNVPMSDDDEGSSFEELYKSFNTFEVATGQSSSE